MTRNLRGRRAGKQAQLPRNNAIEREAAILEERSLGGVVKMAAPTEKGNSGAMLSVKRVLAEGQKAEEGREREEDVIVISDEEPEGQESFRLGESVMDEQEVNFLKRDAGADGLKESSLVRCSSVRSFEGNFGARNVVHVGDQVDLVDQEGVLVTGLVYGQVPVGTSPFGMRSPEVIREMLVFDIRESEGVDKPGCVNCVPCPAG
ncbi:hypothetical protein NDU88_004681 [Pleurodeles waltl]|uniref:Uncharacterized protein n=1 Tax=Pleurodeles waltl TaxID=8319 RepID=A0AAV7LMG1_PLEWA|nr:hypothetical protein NDU88_004681 [Pleurodeles waltl]